MLAQRYSNPHLRPTQPPTLCETENEYRPKCGDVLRLGVKEGWLIPFVHKRDVSLSLSSITWYRPRDGDALRLGR